MRCRPTEDSILGTDRDRIFAIHIYIYIYINIYIYIYTSPFRKFIGFWCKRRDAGRWKSEKLLQSERDVEVGSWKDPGWKVGGSESEAQPHEATQQPEPPSPLDS